MPASTAGKGSRVFKMQKRDMTQELESGKILPLVFRLTIPAVIAQLITFLYNI